MGSSRQGANCVRKGKFYTERGARWRLAELRQLYPGMYDSLVRPYRCPVCKRWHLGHEGNGHASFSR